MWKLGSKIDFLGPNLDLNFALWKTSFFWRLWEAQKSLFWARMRSILEIMSKRHFFDVFGGVKNSIFGSSKTLFLALFLRVEKSTFFLMIFWSNRFLSIFYRFFYRFLLSWRHRRGCLFWVLARVETWRYLWTLCEARPWGCVWVDHPCWIKRFKGHSDKRTVIKKRSKLGEVACSL